MKNYKVCVVGAGNWGRNHIRTLDIQMMYQIMH